MAKYLALKVCAGQHMFRPGDEIEVDSKSAKPLLADGAIAPLKSDGRPDLSSKQSKAAEAEPIKGSSEGK